MSRPALGIRPALLGLLLAAAVAATGTSAPARGDVLMEGISPGELFPGARFDPSIPTQAGLLGVEHGARPLRHDELMRYLAALDEASPRAKLIPYAESWEGRELVAFVVSDETTMGRLEEFRREHVARVDPRGRPADDSKLLEDAKAVAWVAYGIHGDELSSVDAAAALAYWLVAGDDERAATLRRELVILIDPVENPDGRDRFLAQTRSFAHKVPNPDLDDLSHTALWPWGRGNHYLFDLNRDWFTMVHPESRRSAMIASWEPQLVVDAHEMGPDDTYLFSPPRHPFNPHLPATHLEWWDRFAADQARALDARGYPYYTREWNEEFFPGYGSSWAAYRGALGILYEMSSTEGTLVRKPTGELRTYAQAIEHQATSSVANLETLAANRAEILRDYVADRREIVARAEKGGPRAWVLPEGRYPRRTRKLVRLLRRQGVEVLGGGDAAGLGGLRDARTGEPVDASTLPQTVWVVPVDQPAGAHVRVLLDPHVPMEASFFREEREYLERGKGTRLYETTSWSLPLLYAVEAYWTRSAPGGDWDPAAEPSEETGGVVGVDAPVVWLLEGRSDASVGALADLLQREIRVRVAEKPFRVAGRDYDRGTLLVRGEGNPDDLAAQLGEVAGRWNVEIRGIATGKAESGPDLGGSHFLPLREPRVGILTGPGVSPSQYGALWHLMDEAIGLRFTAIDLARLRRTDLDRYNVLVLPPAFGSYGALVGDAGFERLAGWARAGGTLIGIGAGASFLADEERGLTRARLRAQALDRFPPVVLGPSAEEAQAAGLFRAVGLRAPAEAKDDDGEEGEGKKSAKQAETPRRESPYDVAPVLGPGAAPFAAGHDQGTSVEMRPVDLADWLAPFLPPGTAKPDDEQIERADERLRRFLPRGTFLRLELDPQLWLAWGLPDTLPALARARDALVAEPPAEVAARWADLERLHLGGLLWPEAAGRIARTAYVTRERVERGQVILFLDDPEYRAWTLGTRRLLTNAVLYGPGLGTSWSAPW